MRNRRGEPGSQVLEIMQETRLVHQGIRHIGIGVGVRHRVLDLIKFIDPLFNNGPRQEPVS